MSASLDRLIVDRLEISEERARELLRAMVKELRARAGEDGVRLPELGTFRQEDGTVAFSPSESLRRAVNREYEGLTAEEFAAELEPSEADAEAETAPPFPDEPSDRFESEEGQEDVPYRPGGAELEEESTSRSEQRSPYEPGAVGAGGSEEDAETSTDTEREPSEPERSRRRSTSPDSFHMILAFLLFVVLIGTGWFVLNQTGYITTGPAALFSSGPSAGSTGEEAVSSPDTAVTETERPDMAAAAASPSLGDIPPAEQDSIAPAAGGWTIVVASTDDPSSADVLLNTYRKRFANAGLPVDVVQSTDESGTRYRVGVGQYQSRDAVVQALDDHEANLPEGAWVLRLQ